MPIKKLNYGSHENILFLEFGCGDIMFTRAVENGKLHQNTLIFSQTEPHEIGAETDEHTGKISDDLPSVQMVMRFSRPESITALIHSLVEIQKELFRAKNSEQ